MLSWFYLYELYALWREELVVLPANSSLRVENYLRRLRNTEIASTA